MNTASNPFSDMEDDWTLAHQPRPQPSRSLTSSRLALSAEALAASPSVMSTFALANALLARAKAS
jgi:hypothetical protein